MSYKTALNIGRIFLVISFLSLVGAWLNQLTGFAPLGITQQHMFSDATVLALISIALFIDAAFHKVDKK